MENQLESYSITHDTFNNSLKILIYGDPGAGKTFLAGTAQDCDSMKNVHFLNIDGGMLTLADRNDIVATDVRSVQHLEVELYRIINKDAKYKGIKTIVIDNITELQTLNLDDIVKQELSSNVKRKGGSLDEIYQDDYGRSTKQLTRALRGYRDLPLHVIFLAHRKDKMRKNSDIIDESKPSLTEKLGTAICGYMDFVWYLYTTTKPREVDGDTINETHRCLLTQPYGGLTCKTRGPRFAEALGVVVEDPTFPMIMNIYHNNQKIKGGK